MSIEDMIGFIQSGEHTKANDTFASLIQDRMDTALEQEKIAVASTLFNGTDELDDEEQLEFEFDDEDLELDDEEYEFGVDEEDESVDIDEDE